MFCFKRKNKQNVFENALNYAKLILLESENHKDNHPILDVIRLLGKPFQIKCITDLAFCNERLPMLPKINFEELFFPRCKFISPDGKKFNDIVIRLNDANKEVLLARDLILPWPWSQDRLVNSMTTIGYNRKCGNWKQDEINHDVHLWLPIGIAWVNGGNHSIASGVIQGEGKIKPTYVSDISNVYNYIYCDGKHYIRKEDNKIISEVINVEFAAIFEIGRLMVNYGITF